MVTCTWGADAAAFWAAPACTPTRTTTTTGQGIYLSNSNADLQPIRGACTGHLHVFIQPKTTNEKKPHSLVLFQLPQIHPKLTNVVHIYF